MLARLSSLSRFPSRFAPELLLAFLALLVFVHPQLPTDDLLRHVVAYAWHYSHAEMYPLSSQTSYSQYPFFEWLAGKLSLATTPLQAVKVIQLAAALLVIPAVYAAFRRDDSAAPVQEKRWNAVALTLVVLGGGLYARIYFARPEVFALGWAALSLSLTAGRKNPWFWLWLTTAPLVVTSYWLAWLAWPVILVSRWCLRQKLATLAALTLTHATFWLWYTHGDYLHVIARLAQWTAARLVPVSEGRGLASLLTVAGPLAMAMLACRGWVASSRREQGWAVTALVPYFVLNMVRYSGTMGLCVRDLLLNGWKALNLPLAQRVALACLMTAALTNSIKPTPVPLFKLPAGSRVLAPFDVPIFSLALANPGTVQLLPSMEVGASDRAVQLAVVALNKGQVDCALVKQLGVTHIVENRLTGTPSACLRLQSLDTSWRLWQVVR